MVYLLETQTFKDKIISYLIIFNEVIVIVYYLIISMQFASKFPSTKAENLFICICVVALAVFFLFNLTATFRNIYKWIQKKRASRNISPQNITVNVENRFSKLSNCSKKIKS